MPKAKRAAPVVAGLTAEEIIADYRLAYRSRQASVIGRREVLSGKAKFGIFGDGKEIVQVAMAHAYQPGDIRAGYYRDQTLMFALEAHTISEYFAQLYAHADLENEPATGGRAMNGHFATRFINPDGTWKNLTAAPHSSADISPTGGQMPRLVGLAYASRLYREIESLKAYKKFSNNGNEIAWGTIGNASTAEGPFWEAVNAIGVLKAPAIITVYDDGYGISVPNQFQMVKENISTILQGFQRKPCPGEQCDEGYDIYTVPAWNYPTLIETFQSAANIAREYHIPALVHVIEVTQPQGHSTSGSHERYKSPERLAWEKEFDCLTRMRAWMIAEGIASEADLEQWEASDLETVEEIRKQAWAAYQQPILANRQYTVGLLDALIEASPQQAEALRGVRNDLLAIPNPWRRDIAASIHQALRLTRYADSAPHRKLLQWKRDLHSMAEERYDTYLYLPEDDPASALNVPITAAQYGPHSPTVYGFEIMNACFDAALGREPRLVAFGEDVGKLGDVNQGFKGLQEKYGALRVADTGIREATIIGQAIGMAMRGLRPIAEVQYLDYLLYALQIMSDDLATLLWRTKGGQRAPVIVRTRGHRLEGIWHSGSLMAGLIHLVRGMHVLVPRNMTQAAGFYNTLLQAEEPAIIVEVLNGYRRKERLPDNIGEFTVPLGVPETLRPGRDLTIVTYGACCPIVLNAAEQLAEVGIEAEVIDVQSLLPFDRYGQITESIKKTSRVLFVDEDVPGGTTAYMMRQVLEVQGGFQWLDSAPRTLPGKEHRPAYGSDGDYWSKPNAETIFEAAYGIMHESNPQKYPLFY
ncbi:MAG: alpha-ketoacid dehydrogenase subunit alpha/beta [Anaerolineales bacterium]